MSTLELDMSALRGRRVVLGVSGGIAAYKAIELCRRLVDAGTFVSPILTHNATRFVGEATFAALASEPPRKTLWDSSEPSPHTHLGQKADLIVVAPATARIIASYANGLSDDLLATTLIASRAPVVLCPAMHTEMWEHPAVQANIATLKARGVHVVEPESGHLAGGDSGVGRLADIALILSAIGGALDSSSDNKSLRGRRVLVTAGGTREPIDPVRFIANRSSGKQGYAVAQVAVERGASVTLVTSVDRPVSPGVEVVRVDTAAEMCDAVLDRIADADILVMAAAVADYTPEAVSEHKIKKSGDGLELKLVPTKDVLKEVANVRRQDQVIVGFAAETQDLETAARGKLLGKKLDVIVANDVSSSTSGIGHDLNSAVIIDSTGRKTATGTVEKRTVAASLLDAAERLLGGHAEQQAKGSKYE